MSGIDSAGTLFAATRTRSKGEPGELANETGAAYANGHIARRSRPEAYESARERGRIYGLHIHGKQCMYEYYRMCNTQYDIIDTKTVRTF